MRAYNFFGCGPNFTKFFSSHMGDRPSHLGDIAPQSATKKKEKTTAKHKPTWNYRSGWPNKNVSLV